jgi:FkbM family methyltransferase
LKMPAMIINTSWFFGRLLQKMHVDVVCDVGSMDGADALRFRDARPSAQIYAFEVNPENLRLMNKNPLLRERDIQVVGVAASDVDGEADFFIVPADYSYSRRNDARGMSSLYRRASNPAGATRVATTRLDTFLRERCSPRVRIGLWIDVEGKAFEVIRGTLGIIKQLRVLHVEVETRAEIAADQKLYEEVKLQLRGLGFSEVATDKSTDHPQFNAVFVRNSWNPAFLLWLKTYLLRERLQSAVATTLQRLRPGKRAARSKSH